MISIHKKIEAPAMESGDIFKFLLSQHKQLAIRWKLSNPEWFVDDEYGEIFCSDERGSFRLDVVDHSVFLDAKLSTPFWSMGSAGWYEEEFDSWMQGVFQARIE